MSVNTKLVIDPAGTPVTVNADLLMSLSATMSASVDGGEIAVDTLTAVVLDTTSSPAWNLLDHGTVVQYWEGTDLIGTFYLSSVYRVAKNQYELKCTSALGLLEDISHAGGVYGGVTVLDVLDEIIGSTFAYTVSSTVSSWTVGGWLPYDTARANLHRLLLAMGINLLRDSSGGIVFGLLSTASPISIPDNEIYIGGEVGQVTPATSVAVTEHQYLRLPAERETLYDSSDGSAGQNVVTVKYSGPYYDVFASTGLTIIESGDNYARVQGVGVLTGVPYTHTERIVKVESQNPGPTLRELTVTDDGLINPYNSARVAQRLLDYHETARRLQGKLVIPSGSTVRPGKYLSMSDAFGDPVGAILSQMNIKASATVAADIQAVTGYQEGESGNTYTGSQLITEDTVWEAPQGHLRIILIGGGQGGQGGYNGEPGAGGAEDPIYGSIANPMYHLNETNSLGDITAAYDYYRSDLTSGGKGGKEGRGGASGNVLVLDVDVTPGEELTFHVGAGGAAGTANGGIGGLGGASTVSSETIGSRSSAEGSPSNLGVWDVLGTGDLLAAPGADGTPGADGGASTATQPRGWDGGDGTDGGDVGTATGGAGGTGASASNPVQDTSAAASGGGGGGAAVGHNGGSGGNGSVAGGISVLPYAVTGGNGGNGANADAPSSATYGCGGNGGNGGGGGGNAGGGNVQGQAAAGDSTMTPGTPGTGGSGSAGSAGGAGCILVLWDVNGRNLQPTRLGPTVVEVRQNVGASSSGVSFAEVTDSSLATGASTEATTQPVVAPSVRDTVVFGQHIQTELVGATIPAAEPSYVPIVTTVAATPADGEKTAVESMVATQLRAKGTAAGMVRAEANSAAETQISTESDVKTAEMVSGPLDGTHQEASAEAGVVGAVRSALSEAASILSSVAASLWGRWAWMEGDTLYIDQEFGGAAQSGGTLAVD